MSKDDLDTVLEKARSVMDVEFVPVGKGVNEVTERLVQQWCYGLGIGDPIHWSDEAARAEGYPHAQVPPSFVNVIARGPSYGALYDYPETIHSVHGQSEYEFLEPLSIGDRIEARARITSVRASEGKRFGPIGIVDTTIEYVRGDGVVVAIQRHSGVLFLSDHVASPAN